MTAQVEEMPSIFRQAIASRLDRLQQHLDDIREYADEEWDDCEGIRRAVGDIDKILPELCRWASKLEDAIYDAEQAKTGA